MKVHPSSFISARRLAAILLLALPLGACDQNPAGVGVPPALARWKQVATSNLSTCGLRDDGRAYCWAFGDDGHVAQAYVQPEKRFTALSSGAGTCGLTTGGEIYCWPRAGTGTPVSGGYRFRQVAGGSDSGCGIATDGATLCWNESLSPSRLAGDPGFASISMGSGTHGCGLTAAGEAWCWGGNDRGQLGDSTYVARPFASRVVTERRFVEVRTGYQSTCARTADGVAYCWGDNTTFELGSPYSEAHGCVSAPAGYFDLRVYSCSTPQPVATALRFTTLTVQAYNACGLADGKAYCWGANVTRSLGVPDSVVTYASCRIGSYFPCTPVPTTVAGNNRFVSIGTEGWLHDCGIVADGSAYCWGGVDAGGFPAPFGTSNTGPVPPVRLPEPAA